MSGGNTATTLLTAAAIVGTGGAALGAMLPASVAAGGFGSIATGLATHGATLGTIGALSGAGLQVLGGMQESQAAKFEKAQYEQQIQREKTRAAVERADRERRLTEILSSQRAAFASRGISLTSGVAQTAAQASTGAATREQAISSMNTVFKQGQLASSAAQKSREARVAVTGGIMKAGQSLLTFSKSGQ